MSAKGFIFDGFPRTIAQAEALDKILTKNNMAISKVVLLEVEEEELVKRVLGRGKESGRVDDQNEILVRNRIKLYFKETLPVAQYYKKQNKLATISGIGNVEEVYKNICDKIDE